MKALTLLFLAVGSVATAQSRPIAPAELTAEGYRDLILRTADALGEIGTYGQVTAGTGSESVGGRQVSCWMTFTHSDSTTRSVANRQDAWARARVPKSLAESHAAVLIWIRAVTAAATKVPKCFLPLVQASEAQYEFHMFLGGYVGVRTKAATALAALGVTLPSTEKK